MVQQMIAALYVRDNSIYKSIPGVDAWTKGRDARNYPGGFPVIAHPPCRAWGKFSWKAKAEPGEKELAILAVQQVRENAGILEHPVGSALFKELELPLPGDPPDQYGGKTVKVSQQDFGHRAIKDTYLYYCGVELLPLPPKATGEPIPVEFMGRPERERTPLLFATWLVSSILLSRNLATG